MSFVKLDCRTLDSSLWADQEACRIFFAALMMARPVRFDEPQPQLEVGAITETGFVVPPGWYGFVEAAGPGIVRRALMDESVGVAALERLGKPEDASRSSAHEGRRMVRVNGGYVILNFWAYREKDHTAAIRMKRHRARKRKGKAVVPGESGGARAYDSGDTAGGDAIAAEGLRD